MVALLSKNISHGLFVLNTSWQNSARTYSKIKCCHAEMADLTNSTWISPSLKYSVAPLVQAEKPQKPLTHIYLWRPFCYKRSRFLIWWSLKSYQKLGTLLLPSFLFSSTSLCPAHSQPLAGLQMLQAHTPLGAIAKADFLCSRCSRFSFPPLLLLALYSPWCLFFTKLHGLPRYYGFFPFGP